MKKKEELTEKEKKKIISNKMRGLKARVKNGCGIEKEGLNSMRYRLEYIKDNPATLLPVPELNYDQTIQAYEEGIEAHLEKYRK